jgi:hypothetical protein
MRSDVIKASVYVNGTWHTTTLKDSSAAWRGGSRSRNISVTYTGLTDVESTITNIRFKATGTYSGSMDGQYAEIATTACNDIPIKAYVESVATDWHLYSIDYGSGNGWHGAQITRQIGADAMGVVGATHFHFFSQICVGIDGTSSTEVGAFNVKLRDASGRSVAGIRIQKTKAGKAADLIFYVNEKQVNTTTLDIPYESRFRAFYIRKNGSEIQFNFDSYIRHYSFDEIADMAVTQVTYCFEAYADKIALRCNGFQTAKFTKTNCDTWKNVPNKFTANDVLEADCKTGKIYLNGIEQAELGALGNDWEGFYLVPGLNQIGFAYSDWVAHEYAPRIKVKYREVFL